MSSQLNREDARAIARVLYAVHQRRAAREAAEQERTDSTTPDEAQEAGAA